MEISASLLNQLISGLALATSQYEQGRPLQDVVSGLQTFLPTDEAVDGLAPVLGPLRKLSENGNAALELTPQVLGAAFHDAAQGLSQLTRDSHPQVSLWAEDLKQRCRSALTPKAPELPKPQDEQRRIEWLRDFIEFSPEPMGVVECRPDGAAHMVMFNRLNRERWGLKEEDVSGLDVARFFYPEDQPMVREFIMECLRTGSSSRTGVRMLRRAGGHLLVDMYVGLVRETNYAYFQVINETQREQALEQVRIREAVFRNAEKPLLMLSFDEGGNPSGMLTSAGFDKMLGYKPGEIGSRAVIDFIPRDQRVVFAARVRKFLATGTLRWEAAELVRKDGSTVLVDIEANDSGVRGTRFAIASFSDTNARITAERDAAEAQKLDIIASVTAGIAHDGGNLLTILTGGLDLLIAKYPGDPYLSEAISKSEMLNGMFSRFRRITDASGKEGGLDLHTILSENDIRLVAKKHMEITIAFDLAESPWTIDGPAFAVWQIVFNMIKNAVESMEKTPVKKLTLRTENIHIDNEASLRRLDPDQRFATARPGDFLMLSVEDTGSGIPPDVLPRIFEDYFSTKEGSDVSRGRGLSTSQWAVAKRGGLMSVTTEMGRGSVFRIYLPRRESQTPVPPPVAATSDILPNEKSVSPGGEVILIADDDEGIRNQYQRILKFYRYQEILTAATMDEVLETVRRRPDLTAVIMDWRMPGMTGDELLNELADLNPDLPILVNTALVPEHAKAHPRVQFVKKLSGATRVADALRRLIKGEAVR